ncbi:MAG TPA: phosphatase PAP2 family protein [Eudoraea sp.]|nr:phosphatase PAP2 family protein [Eudoraea sp.]
MLERILEWDRQTFIYLNGLGVEKYDAFWSAVTSISTWIPLFLLFLILIYLQHPKKEALAMSLMVLLLLGVILTTMELTKEFVGRLRPNNDVEVNTLIRILKSPANYSFFSGHAATSFGITTLMVLFLGKKLWWVWIFYIWPLLFATSRIYVGVHYPLDILAGVLIGCLYAYLFYRLYRMIILPGKW